jgi:phosphatidylinositol 4-kinase type 2
MFARQLAVLKGQAWNVLETLKQPDQGPLELCRRQRVLVNDEEMEVPVVVPMTVPTIRPPQFHEEMDISSLGQASSAPPPQTRLSRTPETKHLYLNSDEHDVDITRTSYDELDVPARESNVESLAGSFLSEDLNRSKAPKPHGYFKKSRNRMSYDGPSRPLLPTGRRRGYSVSESAGLFDEEDEEERDIGFAAAQDEDALIRKVIVEKCVLLSS